MFWFTSDLHYGHKAIINMCERPFKNVEEMNKTLVENWNDCVKKNDTVYILGDMAFRIPVVEANEFIKKLNGKKILIKGNHDKNYDESLFEEICDFKEINLHGVPISLMHYPMVSWPKSNRGSIHLHGHQHNTSEYNLEMKKQGIHRYDVGVDANDFRPVSLQEILNFVFEEWCSDLKEFGLSDKEIKKYDIMMEFYLSEEKAKQYNYNIEKCYRVIDEYFAKKNVRKVTRGVYIGVEDDDWSTFMIAAVNFPDKKWFMNIIDEWYLRQEDLDKANREDCLKTHNEFVNQNKR